MNLYSVDTDISQLDWLLTPRPQTTFGFTFGDNKQGIMA